MAFESFDSLWSHIVLEHVGWTPYECVICPQVCMPSETVLKRHYEETHPGKVPKAIYTYREDKKREARRIYSDSKKLRGDIVNRSIFSQPLVKQPRMYDTVQNGQPLVKQPRMSDTVQNEVYGSQLSQSPFADEKEANYGSADSVEESIRHLNSPTPLGTTSPTIVLPRIMEQETDIDTPSAISSNSDGKQCQLCQRHILLSARNKHIWSQHMPRGRLQCDDCGYGTWAVQVIKRHIAKATDHHRMTYTDHIEEMTPQYVNVFKTAFGTYCRVFNGGVGSNRLHNCAICGRSVKKAKSEHIWQHHMLTKRYSCRVCDKQSATLQMSQIHAQCVHQLTSADSWTDNTEANIEEYMTTYKRAFDRKGFLLPKNSIKDRSVSAVA